MIWLDRYIDWKAALAACGWNAQQIFYIGLTDGENFSLTCTKKCPKNKMFPGEWRGMGNEELEKKSGINGLRFIHEGGWKAKARNKEALIRLIESSGDNKM